MKRTCLTFNKENNDEFADDDWNEEDFAKIDQCVAMSQCKVTKNLLGEDEFDALNDEDLAAIDIPLEMMTMTSLQPLTSRLP